MDFRIRGLDPAPFARYFEMDERELARHRAVRRVADEKPGFPCRVSLADVEPGSPVILLNYEHLPVESPYRASHAIFVGPAAEPSTRSAWSRRRCASGSSRSARSIATE